MTRYTFRLFVSILFTFVLILTRVSAQERLDMEAYFNHLKRLEFSSARASISKIKEASIRQALLDLVAVLENDGQRFNLKDFQVPDPVDQLPANDLVRPISLLTQSCAEIVYKKITEKTFTNLTDALDMADYLGQRSLKKQVLLSILDLYRKDVIQIDKDYKYFLDEYKNHTDDTVDSAYYAIMNFVFESKSDEPVNEVFHRSAYLMDSVFRYVDNASKLVPFYLFEKGIYYEILNENEKAKCMYDSLLQITPDAPYYRYINFGTYLKLSEIAGNQRNYEHALSLLEKTKRFKDASQPLISDYYYYSYGARYHDHYGNCGQALAFLKKAKDLEVEINKVNIMNKRTQALVAYQTLEKEKLLLEQEKELILERERKAKSRNLAIVLGITLFLSLIIGWLAFRNSKRKEMLAVQEKDIHKGKVANLLKDQELKSINAMLAGEEKERKRIAEDLHDRVGSMLSALKLQVDTSNTRMVSLLDETAEEVRRISHNLETKVLNRFGLVAAIEDLAVKVNHSRNVTLDVHYLDLDERLDNTIEIPVYRIVQELVSNSLKHSEATEITVQINRIDHQLIISVEDNGIGFDSMIAKKSEGMGLRNVASRTENLNGELNIDSGKGKGTIITVEIPI